MSGRMANNRAEVADALHNAIELENPTEVRQLISKGPDMSRTNSAGETPLEAAMSRWWKAGENKQERPGEVLRAVAEHAVKVGSNGSVEKGREALRVLETARHRRMDNMSAIGANPSDKVRQMTRINRPMDTGNRHVFPRNGKGRIKL